MEILICTDGSPAAEAAAALVARLGIPAEKRVTLLGVWEKAGEQAGLKASMDRMASILGPGLLEVKHVVKQGQSVDQILAEVQGQAYDLVAMGSSGHQRGLRLLNLGSTSSKLARKIHTHLLVARGVPDALDKVLICTGAETPSVETMHRAGALLQGAKTEIGLLHVMSQVALKPESAPEDLFDTAKTAINRKTREGKHLQDAIQQLRTAGVSSPIVPQLRHGLVVEQVLAELGQGHYDLLVVGAHHQPGQNRWLEILLDDVADRLLNHAPCSVLVV